MKWKILQETLQSTIQDLQKSVPTKPSLPILSCFYIKSVDKKTLSFSATDLQVGIRTQVMVEVLEEGEIAVPAKVFMDFIATLSPGQIEISVNGQTMTIQAKESRATLQCFTATDFPPFPEKEGEKTEIPVSFFVPAIQNTSFSASVDEARPALTALLFSFGEKTEAVATDGFRLSQISLDFSLSSSEMQTQLLLPAKALNEVLRIAQRKKTETVVFTVSQKLKQVFFSFNDVEMLVRIMDGDFPPYQKIIPADFQTELLFDGEEFGQKIKSALIFARESSGIIRFHIQKTELKILSASSTTGSQESSLPIKLLKGGEQEIAFNAKYVTDFLNILKPKEIWMGMNESLKPAMLRPNGLENYRYIIMPFRVNQ